MFFTCESHLVPVLVTDGVQVLGTDAGRVTGDVSTVLPPLGPPPGLSPVGVETLASPALPLQSAELVRLHRTFGTNSDNNNGDSVRVNISLLTPIMFLWSRR